MLYQPTNISPSMLGPLGNGVIDANEDFVLSFQVNGNSPLVKFTLFFSEDGSTISKSFGRELDQPFYGTDYAGNVQMFRMNLGGSHFENGKSYKMRIRQYWSETEYVDQQSQSAFITRDRPVVTITQPIAGSYISSKKVTIAANYTQAQGETLNWVRWQIAEQPENWDYSSAPEKILKDTGPIYGTSQLQYVLDGVFPGKNYIVQCTVQTQSGMEASSTWSNFTIDEYGRQIDAQITACAEGKIGGVRLALPPASSIPGNAAKEARIENGELVLDGYISDSRVVWDAEPLALWPLNYVWKGRADIRGEYAQINLYSKNTQTSQRKQTDIHFSDADLESTGVYSIYGSGTWRKVVCPEWGNHLYMALGDAGVAYSSDGKAWKMSSIPSALSGNLSALRLCAGHVSGADYFLLASSATTTAAYTTDGETWTTITMPKAVKDVFFAGYRFFAAYTSGGLGWAYGGRNWTWNPCSIEGYEVTSPITGVCFGNDRYCLVAENGACAYSDGGLYPNTWVSTGLIAESSGDPFFGLCFGNGVYFVRCGGNGYYSDDGVNWGTSSSSGALLGNGNDVIFGGGLFLCANGSGASLSMNGSKWYSSTGTASGTWKSGCFDGTQFVLVGTGGKAAIFNSYHPFEIKVMSESVCSGKCYAKEWFSFLLDGEKMYLSEDRTDTPREFSAPLGWDKNTQITELTLNSYQTCTETAFYSGKLTQGDISSILRYGFDGTVPTQFYANFENGLNGGQFGTTGYDKFAIYRMEGSEEVFRHVGDLSVEDGNILIDASAVNGKIYTYYAYGVGALYSNAVISQPVHDCSWNWHVLACTQDEAGVYHVQKFFRFGNNVSSGSVSNNAVPSVLQNFTRYPVVQNSPWNYRSGMLTSMIGYTENGVYFDNTKLRDEIAALTTSGYALFLKNRKGDVIHIAISGAIEMETMDNSAQQAQTVKLPWVEIADASSAQIVITKNDGAFLQEIPSLASEHGIDTAAVYFG